MCRLLRRLLGLREPGLFVDLRRVNQEERLHGRWFDPDDNVTYRTRVRCRIIQGLKCEYPPLYGRVITPARPHVVPFRQEEGHDRTIA